MAQNSRISCGQPKIGLQSSKRRSRLTRKGPTERSSGSIVSTPRLKIDFSDRVMTAAAHRKQFVVAADLIVHVSEVSLRRVP